MKILYFHQHFTTPSGGGGIRSYQMALHLIDRGHSVTMVCGSLASGRTGGRGPFIRGIRRGCVEGIDVVEINLPYSNHDGLLKRSFIFFRFMWKGMQLALGEQYDILFATSTPLTVVLPGLVGRWIKRRPFVFEVRDLWPELPRAMGVIKNPLLLGMLRLLELAGYKSADRLIGLSPGIVDGICQSGISRAKVTEIPNGCDLDIFGADVDPKRPPGVSKDDLVALYCGTHGPANGLDSVISAAIELQRRDCTEIKIVLIGDGKTKSSLVSASIAAHLSNIIFLDPMGKDDLAQYVRGADIGLQILANVPAFYYGTSPNKFFDYLAAGLPVLTNYPGWVADLINENECGFSSPPNDPIALADAFISANSDRRKLTAMGTRARRLAEDRFDRNRLANKWVSWIESACSPEM
jgi:glycosyltransferase involved in cell wall biosynthesis